MKRLLLAGAAFAALSSASYAADLGYAPAPVDVWSGFFVGIQGGYSWANVDGDFTYEGGDDGSWSFDPDEFVGGIFYGKNWQSGNWVYGIDSSITYLGLDEFETEDNPDFDFDTDGFGVEAKWLGASRLKIGYAFDNFLVFAAGGLAVSNVEVTLGDEGEFDSDDDFVFGFTVGAGVETKIAENWSARLEYLYIHLEDDFSAAPDGDELRVDYEIDAHIVRAGVAYHF